MNLLKLILMRRTLLGLTALLAASCSETGGRPDLPRSLDGQTVDLPAGGERLAGDRSRVGDGALDLGGGSVAPPPGTLLFAEKFEDTSFSTRGWYDGPPAGITLSTVEHKEGIRSFECLYKAGANGCAAGTPGRHQFAESETVYLRYWVKYSQSFVGSQKPYHPHEFHFVTNADDKWVGPASTHLTTYIEQIGGVPHIALQDSLNVDLGCVLLNDGSFVGCNGSFSSYVFTENRSVCACNGIVGDLEKKDCFKSGGGYYSSRAWSAKAVYFKDQPGPEYKNDWHQIEAYFKMNSIVGGKGVADGVIRYWYDGRLIIDQQQILLRTGQHPSLKFNQFLFGMYIGDGSPVAQTMWVDDLVVGTGKP